MAQWFVSHSRWLFALLLCGALASGGCVSRGKPSGAAPSRGSSGSEANQKSEACLTGSLSDSNARFSCLLALAGANDVFGGSDLRSGVREQLAPRLAGLSEDRRANVEKVLETRFDDAALEARFREVFFARYDEAHVKELLAFYATPLGTKLSVQREEEPSADQLNGWFEKHRPSDARIEQVAQFLRTSHAFESVAAMVSLPVQGMFHAMAPLVKGGEGAPTDEQLKEVVGPAIEQAQTAVAAHTVYTLRVFSDQELAQLAAFEEKGAAQWYHEGLLVSLTTALKEAFVALGDSVATAAGKTEPTDAKQG